MAQRGEGGRALGASLAASAVGGVFGAVFLAALIPIVRPIVLAFGPAEYFFLALLGLTFVGAVSGDDLREGRPRRRARPDAGVRRRRSRRPACQRFSFGQPFLWDGVDVITAVIGIFAIPECLALAAGERTDAECRLAAATRYGLAELLEGVKDVGRHWGLTLRTSFIGAVIGLIPGLGGDVASWMCYGHAVQTLEDARTVRQGRGGGRDRPGSGQQLEGRRRAAADALLRHSRQLGHGGDAGRLRRARRAAGPQMAREHLDLVWVLIWTLVIANLLAAVMFSWRSAGGWRSSSTCAPGSSCRSSCCSTASARFLAAAAGRTCSCSSALGVLGMRVQALRLAARAVRHRPRARADHGAVAAPVAGHLGGRFVLRPVALALACATLITVVVSMRGRARKGDVGAAA